MSDDGKLIERLAYAVHDMRIVDKHPGDDNHPFNIAAAVLPILRAAQADAWDEGQVSGWDEAREQWAVDGMVGDMWKWADTRNPYRSKEN